MRILAIGAHPDDLEILCAGTLAKCAKRGDKIFMTNLCKGDKGTFSIPPQRLAKIRKKEAQNSAKIIGAIYEGGFFPDLDLYLNKKFIKIVVGIIRRAQPDVIITHSPSDYMADHTTTSRLACDASFIATLPNYKTDEEATKVIPPVFFMDNEAGVNFSPTEYVDISDVMEIKEKMLLCHKSQYTWLKEHDNIDYVEFMKKLSALRGLQCGVKYAEGFSQYQTWGRILPKRLLP